MAWGCRMAPRGLERLRVQPPLPPQGLHSVAQGAQLPAQKPTWLLGSLAPQGRWLWLGKAVWPELFSSHCTRLTGLVLLVGMRKGEILPSFLQHWITASIVIGWLSVYLHLRSWSRGPGIERHIGLPAQRKLPTSAPCFSLSLCPSLCSCCLSLSLK